MENYKTELEVGDVVVLNSSPTKPHMTVQRIERTIDYEEPLVEVECVWFDINKKLRAGEFNSKCLEKITVRDYS